MARTYAGWAQTGQEAWGGGLGLNMHRFTLLAHTSSREVTTPRSRGFLKRKVSNTANVPKEHTTTLYTFCQSQFLLPNSHWAIDKWPPPCLPPPHTCRLYGTLQVILNTWCPAHASVERGELNSAQPAALASEQ